MNANEIRCASTAKPETNPDLGGLRMSEEEREASCPDCGSVDPQTAGSRCLWKKPSALHPFHIGREQAGEEVLAECDCGRRWKEGDVGWTTDGDGAECCPDHSGASAVPVEREQEGRVERVAKALASRQGYSDSAWDTSAAEDGFLAKWNRELARAAINAAADSGEGGALSKKEIQTLVAAMAGNHPESLAEYRVPALRKLMKMKRSAPGTPDGCRTCGSKEPNVLMQPYPGEKNAVCPDRFHEVSDEGGDESPDLVGADGKHSVQRDVEAFHRALEIPVGDSPAIRRPELRAELIREEAKETVEAIEQGDLVEAIDGFCDLLCVVYGAAAEFGIDLAPFWDEVHRTNMAKQGGPVRDDGKRLKPPGWTPPDIAGVLARVSPPHIEGGSDDE